MHIPRVICTNDGVEMLIIKTGATVEMLTREMPRYKVSTDIFGCRECGAEVALPASAVIAEEHEPHYPLVVALRTARFSE